MGLTFWKELPLLLSKFRAKGVGVVVAFKYNRHSEAIKWFALSMKMNESYEGGAGHFFPRGALVTVFLGENVGYEKAGQRPALIVSNDSNNKTSGNVLVVPLTKEENKMNKQTGMSEPPRLLRSQYRLSKDKYKLKHHSILQCEDMRVISKERIGTIFDFVDATDMQNIGKRLKYFVGI